MNRLAASAVAWLCISSFACKSGDVPPPAPPPPATQAFPPGCSPIHIPTLIIPVDKLASVPAARECPVLDLDARVVWQGENDVKTLLVGWKPKSANCDQPPSQKPICTLNSCSFDTSQLQNKVDLILCYAVGVIDVNDSTTLKDPRLIIRGRV
jgi:hypothetical protein